MSRLSYEHYDDGVNELIFALPQHDVARKVSSSSLVGDFTGGSNLDTVWEI